MNVFFTDQELNHYARHLNLSEVGVAGQRQLKTAKVLCIGAGGLGSSVLLYLAAAGVGTIGIVDHDSVEISNLQRQVLYTYDDIGQKKVIAAQKKLQELNPHIRIVPYAERLTIENAKMLIDQYDIVIDGSDNFATRYIVNDVCFQLKKPNIYASISQFAGQCAVFTYEESACYRCLFEESPPSESVPNCAEGGVLGVLPGIMGTIQAAEALKLILNQGMPLVNRLLMFDALKMTFREIAISKNPNCKLCHFKQMYSVETIRAITCSELLAHQTQHHDFILLDVREVFEYDICHLNSILIPLGQLASRLNELDKTKEIIVHCKHDGRSQEAYRLLKQAGFTRVSYLKGGIMQWIKEVDSSLQTY